VERFLPLALHLARGYSRGGPLAEDLEQVASIGLLHAIDRFDPERGLAFSSFAVPTIVGEIKRYFRDKGWAVRVPRELQERALRVERVGEQLEHELGTPPTAAQIAQRMDISMEQVLEGRHAAFAHHGVSLDTPNTDGDDDEGGRTLGDTLGHTDEGFGRVEDALLFDRLLSGLSDRERAIIQLRFREDLTQREIGERLGISQMHVSRLLRQGIAQLQTEAARHRDPASRRPALT